MLELLGTRREKRGPHPTLHPHMCKKFTWDRLELAEKLRAGQANPFLGYVSVLTRKEFPFWRLTSHPEPGWPLAEWCRMGASESATRTGTVVH